MEINIKFEREDRNGVIPAGTYLFDAARRFGVEVECERSGATNDCAMQILQGRELFSEVTKAEIAQLSDERREKGERLACQAKIEKAGEIVILTNEKTAEEKDEAKEKQEQYRKEFEELPLEKKIASLLELEGIALSETFSFVMNSPYKIAEKLMDVMAEFGLKFEKEAKEAATPNEHKTENGTKAETAETSEKPKTAKKPRGKKTQTN